ncbi:hypothetical protein F5148DRAFT_79588 [Russula earlei]|uniref:Uncharacterized protein n=1 Tax=Russula earlei TaxID=71964 RepID=A0ACC0U9C5_9AGAM|nr:hypothetical protein F5148DRAFT_79588 [Russula earlei]
MRSHVTFLTVLGYRCVATGRIVHIVALPPFLPDMSLPQTTMFPENIHRSRASFPPVIPTLPSSNSSTMTRGHHSKEEPPLPPKRAPLGEIRPQNPPIQGHSSQSKKLGRRSSKPILDWFQRKLGGTGRTRRASDLSHARVVNGDRGGASTREKRRSGVTDGSRELSRVQTTPLRGRLSSEREIRRLSQVPPSSFPSRSAAVPVNVNDTTSVAEDAEGRGDVSTYRSSFARDSMWSPTSNLEADEDASLRPLPPTASTQPTTLLSVDLNGGMAHIAQAPLTPLTPARIPTHLYPGGPAGGSISFSALPPSPSSSYSTSIRFDTHPIQAPQHTTHHPRNNPRPLSPPLDNASVLTLASSAFGIPGARLGALGGTNDATSFSHFSQFGGSRVGAEDRSSHIILGDDLDVEGDRDFDASVRALRPRSSRRSSWESEASGWSARLGNGITVGASSGIPAVIKERSIRSLSVKTGQMSVGVSGTEEDESSVDAHSNELLSSPSLLSGDGAERPSLAAWRLHFASFTAFYQRRYRGRQRSTTPYSHT